MEANEFVTMNTGECEWCKEKGYVIVRRWQAMELMKPSMERRPMQEILPDHSRGDREQVISGTHSTCFDEMFARVDEMLGE